jgi:hypothetical protein
LVGGFAAALTLALIVSGVELAYWFGRVIEGTDHSGAES